ncbi:MAG: hypothetical protein HY763_09335 [Planctomycetes bacterium]|nr:hypothetical protein [Planctomycetota bacterium]
MIPGPRRTRGPLIALCLAAFAIRIAYCVGCGTLGRTPPVDYREYVMAGARLLHHGTLVSSLILDDSVAAPSNLLPPAYVGLVAGAYHLLGTESYAATLALQMLNAAAIALAVCVVYRTAEHLSGTRAAWLAAAIVTVHPALIRFTDLIWDTYLFALATTVCVAIAACWPRDRRAGRHWLAYGLLLGGVALLNPALTFGYPFLVLWPAVRVFGRRIRPVACVAGAAVCGWLIAIAPWTVRNYNHFHTLSYIRGGLRLEFWLGFCPEAEQGPATVFRSRFPLKALPEQERVRSMGEQQYIKAVGHEGWEAVRAAPGRAARLVARRFADFWLGNALSTSTLVADGQLRSPVAAAGVVVMIAELVVFLACLLFVPRPTTDLWWLLAIMLSFSLIYSATHVMVRFRAPIDPVLAVGVATVVVGAARRAAALRRAL